MPRKLVLKISRCIGAFAFHACGRFKKVAMANLDLAFGGDLTQEAKTAVAVKSFQTACLMFLDIFWFSVFNSRRISAWVTMDSSCDHFFKASPGIIVSAHMGNWEIMAQAVALHGHPCLTVVAPLENPFVDKIMNRFRRMTGQQVKERQGAVRALMTCLKKGGKIALVLDQNTHPRDGGIFVPFFGVDAPVSKAAASLQIHTGADIVLTYCLAMDDGLYKICSLPPLQLNGKDPHSEKSVTCAITSLIESVIREHPDQWLWIYKRWKYIPADALPEKYPFYAKKIT